MRKLGLYVVLIFFTLAISNSGNCQSITEDKIDEFTKDSIRRTSWEILSRTLKSEGYFRISQINGQYSFDLKLMLGSGPGKAFSINEGDKLMFLTVDDEIIELINLKYALTCNGCGSKGLVGSNRLGIEVTYKIEHKYIESLSIKQLKKVRIYTSLGYEEISLNGEQAKMIRDSLNLLF